MYYRIIFRMHGRYGHAGYLRAKYDETNETRGRLCRRFLLGRNGRGRSATAQMRRNHYAPYRPDFHLAV